MKTTPEQVLKALQRICSRQEKCRTDIVDYLIRNGIPEEFHRPVITQLEAEGFVDEERYAKAAVRDKFLLNRWGRLKIGHFLASKQVPEEIVERALGLIGAEEYRDMVENEIRKKAGELSGEESGIRYAKIMRFAVSRGYEEELAREMCEAFRPSGR